MSCARTAVVIGGGPAGCSSAIHLAQRGLDVTLVEARAFPRVKVCGEFVSPAATAFLEHLLPPDRLRELGARRVGRFVLECGDRTRSLAMREPAWALSRATLDDALLDLARASGIEAIEGKAVRGVEYTDATVRTTLVDGGEIESDIVVHADGSGAHDRSGPVPTDRRLVGVKCHLRAGSAIEGVRIRICRGGYVGTIGVESGLGTCALVMRKSIMRACGSDLDQAVRTLWAGFDSPMRATEWKASGVARSGYIRPGHPRSFRVGNAAGAVDPIGGEGIGLALWAGATLGETLSMSASLGDAQGAMEQAYRRRLRVRRWACRGAAEMLMRPALVRMGMSVAPMRTWYRMTGKADRRPEAIGQS